MKFRFKSPFNKNNMSKQKETMEDSHDNEEVTPVSDPVSPEIEPLSQQNESDTDVVDAYKLNAELAETKDRFMRLYSEFDNFRKRTQKERLELLKSANGEIIAQLLPVLDDFERALKYAVAPEKSNSLKEGVELIQTKLNNILAGSGLKKMNSVGENFNDDFHEAISSVPAPKPGMKGKVIDEVECGYFLNDKVIRYAKVIVGS